MEEQDDQDQDLPLEEQLAMVEQEVQLYRSLSKSQGWEGLVKILDQQAEGRLTGVMDSIGHQAERNQVDGFGQLLKHEFDKGVRAGILLVKDLPRAIVEFQETRAREIRTLMAAEMEDLSNG